jgi:hypothetical protein
MGQDKERILVVRPNVGSEKPKVKESHSPREEGP